MTRFIQKDVRTLLARLIAVPLTNRGDFARNVITSDTDPRRPVLTWSAFSCWL